MLCPPNKVFVVHLCSSFCSWCTLWSNLPYLLQTTPQKSNPTTQNSIAKQYINFLGWLWLLWKAKIWTHQDPSHNISISPSPNKSKAIRSSLIIKPLFQVLSMTLKTYNGFQIKLLTFMDGSDLPAKPWMLEVSFIPQAEVTIQNSLFPFAIWVMKHWAAPPLMRYITKQPKEEFSSSLRIWLTRVRKKKPKVETDSWFPTFSSFLNTIKELRFRLQWSRRLSILITSIAFQRRNIKDWNLISWLSKAQTLLITIMKRTELHFKW